MRNNLKNRQVSYNFRQMTEIDVSIKNLTVNDFSVNYESNVTDSNFISDFLNKGKQQISQFEMIDLVRKGISKKNAFRFAGKIDFSAKDLASVYHVSERTLQRYSDSDLLDPELSEKTLQLAILYEKGATVFGNLSKFIIWMKFPNPVFGGKPPLELLDTHFGFQIVSDELIRIEHGVFA